MINSECIQDRILRTEVLTFSVPHDYQLWSSIPLTLSSAIPGFVIPTLGQFEADIWFYDQYYDIIEQRILIPGKKITLGSKKNRQCRFCSHSEPVVEFKNDAHAIPELLGNKVLFTAYECDGCNSMFGNGIEDDLGNWSKPMRALSRVKGKSGVPTVRKSKDGGWRVDCDRGELRVSQSQNDPIFEVDEAKKMISIRLPRDPYTPIGVLKSFVKMGLSLMPESEMQNFKYTLQWIKDDNNELKSFDEFPLLQTLIPGCNPFPRVILLLLKRKSDFIPYPFSIFVISYGNEMFQIFLPSPERNQLIRGCKLKIRAFPTHHARELSVYGPPWTEMIDMTSREQVRGEMATLTMGYE